MAIEIEGKSIGPKARALLIAEMSANHDQDLAQALSLVDLAAEAGWDCIKLQTYSADSLTIPSNHPSMRVDPIWGKENLYELYKSAAMPMEFHKPIFDRAREKGLMPFTSVYDPIDMDFVEGLDCGIYKIASFELTFDDLLMAVAETEKPVILSTGMAVVEEIDHAVEVLARHNSGEVVLLHCCSSYPAPVEDVNLTAMETLKERYGLMVGFSDHTIGSAVPIAAAAMGAVAIEKHYTNDPKRSGPDHRFSATADVLGEISKGASDAHLARGSATKSTRASETVSKSVGRRSAFATTNLAAGHVIKRGDFRFVRPNAGIPANRTDLVIGKKVKEPIQKGDPITTDSVAE